MFLRVVVVAFFLTVFTGVTYSQARWVEVIASEANLRGTPDTKGCCYRSG